MEGYQQLVAVGDYPIYSQSQNTRCDAAEQVSYPLVVQALG